MSQIKVDSIENSFIKREGSKCCRMELAGVRLPQLRGLCAS